MCTSLHCLMHHERCLSGPLRRTFGLWTQMDTQAQRFDEPVLDLRRQIEQDKKSSPPCSTFGALYVRDMKVEWEIISCTPSMQERPDVLLGLVAGNKLPFRTRHSQLAIGPIIAGPLAEPVSQAFYNSTLDGIA